MSEKMTVITLPGAATCSGFMDHGDCSAEAMIATLRGHGAHLRSQAEEIEAAVDADFKIEVVRGIHVQHHIRTIQEGRAK